MKATIKNSTDGPKAFHLGLKLVTLASGEEISGEYEDGLLLALKKTGFEVDHKGELKVGDSKPSKGDAKAAKEEAEKIIAEAKAEAEVILADAKAAADKIIAEAEELAKAEK